MRSRLQVFVATSVHHVGEACLFELAVGCAGATPRRAIHNDRFGLVAAKLARDRVDLAVDLVDRDVLCTLEMAGCKLFAGPNIQQQRRFGDRFFGRECARALQTAALVSRSVSIVFSLLLEAAYPSWHPCCIVSARSRACASKRSCESGPNLRVA